MNQPMKLDEIQNELRHYADMRKCLLEQASKLLTGATAIINDANFNGQPYGSSKKSLFGRSWVIEGSEIIEQEDGELTLSPPFANDVIYIHQCIIEWRNEQTP